MKTLFNLFKNIFKRKPEIQSPSDKEILLVISEIANHYKAGLAYSLHNEYYINKVRSLFSPKKKPIEF